LFYYDATPRFSDEIRIIFEIHLQMDCSKMVVFHPLSFHLVLNEVQYTSFCINSVTLTSVV